MQVVMYSVHHRTDKLDLMQMSESELKVNPLFFPQPPGKSNQLGLPKEVGRYGEQWQLTKCHSYIDMGQGRNQKCPLPEHGFGHSFPSPAFSMNRGIISFTKPELSEKCVRHIKNLAIRVNELKPLFLSSPTSDREFSLLLPELFFCRWTLFCQKRTSSKFSWTNNCE